VSYRAHKLRAMSKPTEFNRWYITDERTGKRRRTPYARTREQAAERFPDAEPDLHTLEVRNLPENDDEVLRSTHPGRGRP
jgi:hypothetical protein